MTGMPAGRSTTWVDAPAAYLVSDAIPLFDLADYAAVAERVRARKARLELERALAVRPAWWRFLSAEERRIVEGTEYDG